MGTGVTDHNLIIRTLHVPYTCRTPFRFIQQHGTLKVQSSQIYNTDSTGIHPALLQLGCRNLETAQIMSNQQITPVRRKRHSTQGITSVGQLNILYLPETVHINHRYASCYSIHIRPLHRQEISNKQVFSFFIKDS